MPPILNNLQTWLTCKLIGQAGTPSPETLKAWITTLAPLTGDEVPDFVTAPTATSRKTPEIYGQIERDEAMNRSYIPLPGGWELQTKGSGSTLRLLDKKSGERFPLPLPGFVIEFIERMALEVHAAICAMQIEKQDHLHFTTGTGILPCDVEDGDDAIAFGVEPIDAALAIVQQERDELRAERDLLRVARQQQHDHAMSERAKCDELRAALESCCVHMERARDILTGSNPRPDCNWGMLDTSNARAVLTPKATQQEKQA